MAGENESVRAKLIDDFSAVLSEAEDMLQARGDRNGRQGPRSALAGRGEAADREARLQELEGAGDRPGEGRGPRHRRLRPRQSVAGDRRRRGGRLPRRPGGQPPLAVAGRAHERTRRRAARAAEARWGGSPRLRVDAAAHARRARRARVRRGARAREGPRSRCSSSRLGCLAMAALCVTAFVVVVLLGHLPARRRSAP